LNKYYSRRSCNLKAKGMKWIASLLSVMLITGLFPIYGLAVVKAAGNEPLFAGGSGTEEDPFLISTANHLNNIREYHSDNKHFKLANDIRISSSLNTWNRIQDGETSQLVLDGNRYTIYMDVLNQNTLE